MEVVGTAQVSLDQQQSAQPLPKAERLNSAVQQQLNLDSVKTRTLGLNKAISRILEDLNPIVLSNATPKWQDILGQFSMVNMELFNIVEDIKKVSKAFVVNPKNVNGENALILPVMLSSKLLPEMEVEDNARREQLLSAMANLPITTQVEKLKARIDMIGAACETAEKIIADSRKAYGLGSRQGPTLVPTLDKVQAAKIQEQENQLRAAVNFGEGLRITGDQRHLPSSLPSHLVDVLAYGDGAHNFGDSGAFTKNSSVFSSNTANPQGSLMQMTGGQMIGRSVPSPSGISGTTSFDNASTPPLPYANSPKSDGNVMNAPSPQQQKRQKLMHISQHQQQLLSQQQLRQPSTAAILGQVPGQHQIQYSQALSQQQFQNRQLQSAHIQHNIAQNQMGQASQLRNQLNQLTGSANAALFNAAQTPNSQMMANMSATMQPQSLLPRMQLGLSGGLPQRNLQSQILNDQMFVGSNSASLVQGMQQQQQQQHGSTPPQGVGYSNNINNPSNSQSMQPTNITAAGLPNNPSFQQQQRQQNQH